MKLTKFSSFRHVEVDHVRNVAGTAQAQWLCRPGNSNPTILLADAARYFDFKRLIWGERTLTKMYDAIYYCKQRKTRALVINRSLNRLFEINNNKNVSISLLVFTYFNYCVNGRVEYKNENTIF